MGKTSDAADAPFPAGSVVLITGIMGAGKSNVAQLLAERLPKAAHISSSSLAGSWHTFWNPGDSPTRILEIISPAGLEDLFRELGAPGGEYDPSTLPALAARYGCKVDFERTLPIVERHSLKF